MRCPLCDVPMREVTRRGVQVDVCPECRGIWLDRGELERLLDVAADEEESPRRREEREPSRARSDSRDRDDDRDDDRGDRRRGDERRSEERRGEPPKKRRSWLSDILETVGGGEAD